MSKYANIQIFGGHVVSQFRTYKQTNQSEAGDGQEFLVFEVYTTTQDAEDDRQLMSLILP